MTIPVGGSTSSCCRAARLCPSPIPTKWQLEFLWLAGPHGPHRIQETLFTPAPQRVADGFSCSPMLLDSCSAGSSCLSVTAGDSWPGNDFGWRLVFNDWIVALTIVLGLVAHTRSVPGLCIGVLGRQNGLESRWQVVKGDAPSWLLIRSLLLTARGRSWRFSLSCGSSRTSWFGSAWVTAAFAASTPFAALMVLWAWQVCSLTHFSSVKFFHNCLSHMTVLRQEPWCNRGDNLNGQSHFIGPDWNSRWRKEYYISTCKTIRLCCQTKCHKQPETVFQLSFYCLFQMVCSVFLNYCIVKYCPL